ncbi:hypothetical protein JCM10908_002345 [Rhodotorula pacifica]|uniref:uncharacterized protein n=1 Tax=Rhodotorula pacifica TaxID=1495444 RepID=UPI00317B1C17
MAMATPATPASQDRPAAREEGQPPDRFDRIRYEDLSDEESWLRIGKGSFGSVYKGEYLGIEVAIKEVLPSTEYDVEKYMAREIALMQQARHPNVVQYLGLCLAPTAPTGAGADDEGLAPASKRILIISEYLPRGNLRQYILDRSLPFPWRLRISFATDIAHALAYLHARNTMHRDLKGENLLVSDNERLKACDFGLARVAQAVNGQGDDLQQQRKPSDMYTYCGTDGYMSPEILLGLPFDLRTDVYSLGILYIEIASRKLASQTTFVRRPPDYCLSHEEVWSSVSSVCPRSFVDLALECCDPDPDRRPDCKAILRRLRGIEQEVKELEARGLGDEDAHSRGAGTVGSHNVGSISFAGTLKRGSMTQSRRPAAPRLPSFEGAINLTRGSTFAPALAASSAGESGRLLGHARSRSGTEYTATTDNEDDDDDDDGEALFVLAQAEVPIDPTLAGAHDNDKYSTSVFRPSQFRAPYGRLGSTSGSQLPTLPASWIDASRFADASEDAGTATVIAAPPNIPVQALKDPISALTAQTTTLSVAEAVVDLKEADAVEDVFHSAFQEQPAALADSAEDATGVSGPPHRFSLIKPGLQRFLSSLTSPSASSSTSFSPTRGQRHQASESVSRGKCAQCSKGLGLMKAYLACDDCGLSSHIKCSDAVPPACAASSNSRPATPVTPRSPTAAVKPVRPAPLPPTIR